MTRLRWLGTLVVGSSITLTAQQPAPPAPNAPRTLIPRTSQQREDVYRAAHHIVLNVSVTNASGKPVPGLTQEDFTLLDNGQRQKIASFQAVEAGTVETPVRVVLMLDAVNNSALIVARERKELERLLSQNQNRLIHPTAIGLFSAAGARLGEFSQDSNFLIEEVRRVTRDIHTVSCTEEANAAGEEAAGGHASEVTPGGTDAIRTENLLNRLGNCENRRFRLSISALNKLAKERAGSPERDLLIWLGPGWSLLTGPEFRPNTIAMRRSFYDYLADLSTSLREANMTLDAVASPEMLHSAGIRSEDIGGFLRSRPQDSEADGGNLALPVLAAQSGGRVLIESKDLAGAIAECLADIDSYYVLAFDSTPAAKEGEYHSLEVRIAKPGSTVRSLTTYYNQP
jgi:VWFA-related protein